MSRSRFFEGFILGVIATILGLFIADHYSCDEQCSDDDCEECDDDSIAPEKVESRVSKTLDAIEDKFDKLSEMVDPKRSK